MPERGVVLSAFLLAAALAACSDDAPPAGPDGGDVTCQTPLSMRLSPMAVGVTWTYRITDPLLPNEPPRNKNSTIEAYELVGGRKPDVMAYRQRTEKIMSSVVSWHEDRCTSVVRHRETSYDMAGVMQSDQFYLPSKLRVDETPEHMTAGATWTLAFTEYNTDPTQNPPVTTMIVKDEVWTVVANNEPVMVPTPDGTGMVPATALHLNKKTSGNADKDYWFVAGIGKVKETGDQTEELVSYSIPAQ